MMNDDVARKVEDAMNGPCTCGCGPECSCQHSGNPCDEVAEHLFELMDAQMPEEQQRRLRRHCETCEHCSQMTDAEQHVRAIIKRSCCGQSAPATLRMRITSQIAVFRSATQ